MESGKLKISLKEQSPQRLWGLVEGFVGSD
jgi:hypothetical protein